MRSNISSTACALRSPTGSSAAVTESTLASVPRALESSPGFQVATIRDLRRVGVRGWGQGSRFTAIGRRRRVSSAAAGVALIATGVVAVTADASSLGSLLTGTSWLFQRRPAERDNLRRRHLPERRPLLCRRRRCRWRGHHHHRQRRADMGQHAASVHRRSHRFLDLVPGGVRLLCRAEPTCKGETALLATHDAGAPVDRRFGHQAGQIVTSIGCGAVNRCVAVGQRHPIAGGKHGAHDPTTAGQPGLQQSGPPNGLATVRCLDRGIAGQPVPERGSPRISARPGGTSHHRQGPQTSTAVSAASTTARWSTSSSRRQRTAGRLAATSAVDSASPPAQGSQCTPPTAARPGRFRPHR